MTEPQASLTDIRREATPLCAWCRRIRYNESEAFCSPECKHEAIYGDHELAPRPAQDVAA